MKAKTMEVLRNELVELLNAINNEEIDLKVAAEMNNTAGKIINTVRAQLDYHKLRKDKQDIKYLKCN